MRILFHIILLTICLEGFSQSLQPSVINSSGGYGTVGTGTAAVEVYYNIGEPISDPVQANATMLTQGFLQPDILGKVGLSYTPLVSNESCLDKNDGKILLSLNSEPLGAVSEKFKWTPASVCPLNNCQELDSLSPGNYSVTVIAYDAAGSILDSAVYAFSIVKSTEACQVTVYSGFTPNNDGLNEFMYIENIENFPENTVTIYSRWGNKVIEIADYNNGDHSWTGRNKNGERVTAGTYFYVIELRKRASVKKGWVQLTTN